MSSDVHQELSTPDTRTTTVMALATEQATVPLSVPGLTQETHLEYLVRNTSACVLRPFSFFVSWQGVITLAYKGFPPALVNLKQDLTDYFQHLPKENPGSRWPKTSLGALKDGQRLTPEQLEQLNAVCREASGIFQAPAHGRSQAVLVDQLSVITYECRCLERRIACQVLPLQQPVEESDASPEEQQRVAGIIAEADDPGYWFHASRDGSREAHYRGGALGSTLAHDLACFKPGAQQHPDGYSSQLADIVRNFKELVDEKLPGMYTWFDERSLHVTVRAIIS